MVFSTNPPGGLRGRLRAAFLQRLGNYTNTGRGSRFPHYLPRTQARAVADHAIRGQPAFRGGRGAAAGSAVAPTLNAARLRPSRSLRRRTRLPVAGRLAPASAHPPRAVAHGRRSRGTGGTGHRLRPDPHASAGRAGPPQTVRGRPAGPGPPVRSWRNPRCRGPPAFGRLRCHHDRNNVNRPHNGRRPAAAGGHADRCGFRVKAGPADRRRSPGG